MGSGGREGMGWDGHAPKLTTANTAIKLGATQDCVMTRMRQAVCALLFDHLGAAEVTSNAWLDNPKSLAVSRKVGYRQVDVSRKAREGVLVLDCALRLRPDDLVRGEPVEVSGAEPLRAYLGLT